MPKTYYDIVVTLRSGNRIEVCDVVDIEGAQKQFRNPFVRRLTIRAVHGHSATVRKGQVIALEIIRRPTSI